MCVWILLLMIFKLADDGPDRVGTVLALLLAEIHLVFLNVRHETIMHAVLHDILAFGFREELVQNVNILASLMPPWNLLEVNF